ncbi:MAG: aminotransferase class V-fold PLP-dependent enzyme, partial [Phycisphaerales bacterium JB039]
LGAVTERTRICLLSHITSSSGIILPVEGIAGELEARGIRVIIDGAHAPGQIELDIGALAGGSAPSCYVANLHKWLCAPKGAAMLWIREDLRASFRPLVLSNSAELAPPPGRSKLHLEFDYAGTGDMTPWLTIPAAMETMAAMAPGGWGEIRARNHDLALRGRNIVCGALGVESPAPDSMLGAMTTIVLPQHPPQLQERLRQRPTGYHDALQDALVGRWGIQIPVFYLPQAEPGPAPVRCLRLSAQLYNSPAQYEYLAEALRAELEAERRLG